MRLLLSKTDKRVMRNTLVLQRIQVRESKELIDELVESFKKHGMKVEGRKALVNKEVLGKYVEVGKLIYKIHESAVRRVEELERRVGK